MNCYKPEYLGRCLPPAEDQQKMMDFVQTKFDAFSKIYEVCKDVSDRINDIATVNSAIGDNSLSVKVSTSLDTLGEIQTAAIGMNVTVNGDILIATV